MTLKPQSEPGGPRGRLDPAYLVAVYAVAVGVTPEFTFLGIPKVRVTDLLLPLIFLVCGGAQRTAGLKAASLPLSGLFRGILFWNLGALLLWGSASLRPGIFYLAKRLIYFLVVYVVFISVRRVQVWNSIIRIMVFTSPLLCFTVLGELSRNIASGGVLATTEGMRASGIIANQQTSTALYIAVITSLALGAWDAFKDPLWKLGALASLITGTLAILATGSRGGLACIVLSMAVTIMRRPRQALKLGLVAALVGSVGWVATPAGLKSRIVSLAGEVDATVTGLTVDESELPEFGSSSVADRVMTARWAMAELLPRAHVLGLGAGFKNLGAIDNFYLTEWMYHGLIGLGLWIALQVGITVSALRISARTSDPVEKGLAFGVATAMIVTSFSGLHAETFYLIRPMEALALMIGLMAARYHAFSSQANPEEQTEQEPVQESPNLRFRTMYRKGESNRA